MTILNVDAASVYCGGRWIHGHVHVDNERVVAVEGRDITDRPEPPYVIPGFVDLHVHGGDGADVMEGSESVGRMARFHANFGTVALCATTVTAPANDIKAALQGVASYMAQDVGQAATVLGAHVEGPFVSSRKLGGQPPFSIDPDLDLAALWCETAPVRIMTLAPELPGSEALIRFLVGRGTRVQIGHSLADAATLAKIASWGLRGVAHLFNATAPIASRNPGVAGWALASAEWAELICDLKHVHPDLMRLAIRSIPKTYSITDCCSAGGCPDGEYRLGQNRVVKRDGFVCLPETDQIAASLLVGIEAFRNLLSLGVGLETAVEMTSARPAQYVGETSHGVIEPGRAASLLILNEDFALDEVWIRGKRFQ